jgi:hypothetical protein
MGDNAVRVKVFGNVGLALLLSIAIDTRKIVKEVTAVKRIETNCLQTALRRRLLPRVVFAVSVIVAVGYVPVQASDTACLATSNAPFSGNNDQNGLHALPHGTGTAPHTALHGQLLLGRNAHYLYHLPLFMTDPRQHAHNFQVILEAALPSDDEALLAADRGRNPDMLYTAAPAIFDQAALVLSYPGYGPLRRLPASVFRGHFEREPNEMIIENSTLEILKVVHFREFTAGGPKLDALEYLLFGREGEAFMAHLLSAPPDFDQVIAVTLSGTKPAEKLLRNGLYIQVKDRANDAASRLRVNASIKCSFDADGGTGSPGFDISVTAENYCETGEVGQVGFSPSRQCP